MGIEVRPVQTAREREVFFTFPWRVYRGDPLWVPPILSERVKRLDPEQSPFLAHGVAEPFVAWRGREPLGTIVVGEDRGLNTFRGACEALFGYFECVDDYEVAEALFQVACAWARGHGLTSLVGPFNLDYEDSPGVLIEGRDRPPALLCGHTPSSYVGFFERFGFQKARGDNLAYEWDLSRVASVADGPPKLLRAVAIARRRSGVAVRAARIEDWEREIDRALSIPNRGLIILPSFIPWTREAFAAHAESLRQIMDPDLILFAEAGGEAVGLLMGLPNVNEALQHCNGLRRPWDYARLYWFARRRPLCLSLKSVAVIPEYWSRGVDALLYVEMGCRALEKGYRWLDLSLTSEDNPMVPRMADRLGARIYKRYRTYRLSLEA